MSKRSMGLLLIFLSLSLYGCSGNQNTAANKIQDQLINMEGYACLTQVSHMNNDKTNTYETKQVYQMDGQYRVEVIEPEHIVGLTTICNGEKIVQDHPKLEQSALNELGENNFRNQMFLGTFVKNYLQSEDVSIEVQNMGDALTTVLEAKIPGGSRHMSTQRVWIDQKTFKPIQMSIYNKDNKETVNIEFVEFTYNPKINQSIFELK